MFYHIPYSSNLVLNDFEDIIKEYALKQQYATIYSSNTHTSYLKTCSIFWGQHNTESQQSQW